MARPEDLCVGCMEPRIGSTCAQCGWIEGTPPDSPSYLPPRTVLDERYLLGKVLGAGGFGITYLAWDLNLDLKLAIKEYFPSAFAARDHDRCTVTASNPQAKAPFDHGLGRFLEEGRALARFEGNPSIASVMNFFRENGTAYLVMKYEDGNTLQEYLKEHGGRIGYKTAVDIAMRVMDGLRAVHAERILHRDISPDNIIITRSGQIKIVDFGAAKRDMTSQDRSLQITLRPGFSPEEQYRSNGRQGPWTDVYALGATLYQCLTGSKPPDALERLDHDTLERPSQLGVQLPPNSERALMKALAVRAPDRFQTIQEFQSKFIIQEPPATGTTVAALAALRNWLRLRWRSIAVAGGAAVVLITLLRVLPALFAVPQIREFTGEPAVVSPGRTATLRWSVSGGSIRITPGIGSIARNTGARQIAPSATTVYTLTARGPIRSVSRSATITVAARPLFITFTADQLTIPPGASTELVWSVGGDASTITIDQGIGNVKASDRLRVSPAANTTYTLKAVGPRGEAAQAWVTILIETPSVRRPVIVSLTANPSTIRRGESTTLAWEVTGDVNSITISPDIGSVVAQGSRVVSPSTTTTYKISAVGPGGTSAGAFIVRVSTPSAPMIKVFSATPSVVAPHELVTLSWTVEGPVDSVTLEPGAFPQTPQSSTRVEVAATTTYTLTARGPGGTVSQPLEVRVSTEPLRIAAQADPPEIKRGQTAMLFVQVTGPVTTTLSITAQPDDPTLTRMGHSNQTFLFKVTPTSDTLYTAVAKAGARSVNATVRVRVKQ